MYLLGGESAPKKMASHEGTCGEPSLGAANRKVAFSDNVQAIYLEPLDKEVRVLLYYSAKEISQMKNSALVEIEATFASTRGQDLFDVENIRIQRPSLCMRPSSLRKICSDRDLSPMPPSSRTIESNLSEGRGATRHPERAHLGIPSDTDKLRNDTSEVVDNKKKGKYLPSSSRRERRTIQRTKSGQAPLRSDGRLRIAKKPQRSKTDVSINSAGLV